MNPLRIHFCCFFDAQHERAQPDLLRRKIIVDGFTCFAVRKIGKEPVCGLEIEITAAATDRLTVVLSDFGRMTDVWCVAQRLNGARA